MSCLVRLHKYKSFASSWWNSCVFSSLCFRVPHSCNVLDNSFHNKCRVLYSAFIHFAITLVFLFCFPKCISCTYLGRVWWAALLSRYLVTCVLFLPHQHVRKLWVCPSQQHTFLLWHQIHIIASLTQVIQLESWRLLCLCICSVVCHQLTLTVPSPFCFRSMRYLRALFCTYTSCSPSLLAVVLM